MRHASFVYICTFVIDCLFWVTMCGHRHKCHDFTGHEVPHMSEHGGHVNECSALQWLFWESVAHIIGFRYHLD